MQSVQDLCQYHFYLPVPKIEVLFHLTLPISTEDIATSSTLTSMGDVVGGFFHVLNARCTDIFECCFLSLRNLVDHSLGRGITS